MAQQLFPAHGTTPGSGTYTEVPALTGRLNFATSPLESYVHTPIAAAGVFTALSVVVATAPGTSTSWTLTLRVNGVASALTVTIAGSATSATITGAVTVAAGDLVGYAYSSTGSPASAAVTATLDFTPDDAGVCVYGFGGRGGWNSSGYGAAGFGEAILFTALSANDQTIVGGTGTVTALVAAIDSTPGANTLTYTLAKNGVLQDGTGGTVATTVTLTGATAQATTTFSLPVVLGDRLAVRCVTTGTPAGGGGGSMRLEGLTLQLFAAVSGTVGTSPLYSWVTGSIGAVWSGTESARQDRVGQVGFTATGLIVAQAGAFSGGTTVTITLRVNGVDTALAVTVSDATPSVSTTGTVAVAAGDLLSYKAVASGASVPAGSLFIGLLGVVAAPQKVGCLVAGVNTTVAATRAISFGLDGDTHIDTRVGTFTVHGDTWLDGETEIEGNTLIHGDLEVEGDTVLDGDVTVLGTLTAPGVPGAPTDAHYVTLSPDTELTAERVLTAGTGITITDGGPGSTVTIAATGGGGGSDHYDAPLSDGDLVAAELIFASGECVIVQVPL